MSNAEHIPVETTDEPDETTDPQGVVDDGTDEDDLDDLDDLEFMLDEIENRIAPLA